AERVAPRRELADEVRKAMVVRVAASFRAQDRDGVGRHLLPVDVEVGRARVEEDEARRVRRTVRAVELLRVESAAEPVAARRSMRPLRTNAGASAIASRTRCT